MSNIPLRHRSSGQEFMSALRAGRGILLGCLAGSALCGFALNEWTTPVYRATTRLEIRRGIEPAPLGAGGFQSENLALYTTAELITNRGLLTQLDADFARRDWLDPGTWSGPWRSRVREIVRATTAGFGGTVASAPPVPSRERRAASAEDRVDWLSTLIKVEPVQDTRLVDIKVEHPDPEAARAIADRLAERFVAYACRRTGAPLAPPPGTEPRGEPDTPSGTASAAIARPSAAAPEDSLPAQALVRQLNGRIANLTDELVSTEADQAAARAQLARCMRWTRDSLAELPDPPGASAGLAAIRQQLVASRMRLASARQVYGERHPKLRALESELEVLRASAERESARAVNEARAACEALATRAAALRADLELTEARLTSGERRVARAAAAPPAAPVRPPVEVVDRATLSPQPVRPRRLLNLAACLATGGLAGCGLASVRHAGRRTVTSPEDIEVDLRLTVLAVLPRTR